MLIILTLPDRFCLYLALGKSGSQYGNGQVSLIEAAEHHSTIGLEIRMEFEVMFKEHAAYKQRFRQAIHERCPVEDPMVTNECRCRLGKWIQGNRLRYGNTAYYQELLNAHHHFHQAVRDVASAISQARYLDAEAMLDVDARFDYRLQELSRTLGNISALSAILSKAADK